MKSLRHVAAASSLLAVLISACGGGAPAAPPAAATQRPVTEISFRQSWLPNPEWAPFVVAQEKGLYAREGITFKNQTGSGSSNAVKLVANGDDQLGHADASAVLVGLAQGLPITPIATINQVNATTLISFEDMNIRSIADLRGKKFAETAASFTYGLFLAAARNQNVDPSGVTLVNVDAAARNQTFLAGSVDAMLVLIQNDLVDIEKAAGARKIRSLPLADLGVKVPGKVVIANNKFLQEKPEAVKAFLKATAEASAQVTADPKSASDLVASKYPELPKDTLLEKVTKDQIYTWTTEAKANGWGYQDTKTWGDLERFLLDAKLLPKAVNIANTLPKQYLPGK